MNLKDIRTKTCGLLFVLAGLTFPCASLADEGSPPTQTILLKDGTLLKGHLRQIEGDVYIIETPHLGEVKVHVSDLKGISVGQDAASFPSLPPQPQGQMMLSGPMGQLQQGILSDPQMVGKITELMKDPQIMQWLNDPALIQDVTTMNPQQIQNNQNFQQLMQHPKMQEIIRELEQKASPVQNP